MEYVLNNFECFKDNEEAYLKVNNNSILYCVVIGSERYISWQKIDSICFSDNNIIELEKSYYDVITGDEILKITEYKSIDMTGKDKSSYIYLLSDLLRIKTGEDLYLSYNDVKLINGFNEKKVKKRKKLKNMLTIF